MKKAIIGKKIGMTQIFTENGTVIPVTVVEAGPCVVVQKKNMDVDGYESHSARLRRCEGKTRNQTFKRSLRQTRRPVQKGHP